MLWLFFFFIGVILFSNWSLHSRLTAIESKLGMAGTPLDPGIPVQRFAILTSYIGLVIGQFFEIQDQNFDAKKVLCKLRKFFLIFDSVRGYLMQRFLDVRKIVLLLSFLYFLSSSYSFYSIFF